MRCLVLLALFLTLLPAAPAAETIAAAVGDREPTAILRTMPSATPPNHQLTGLHFIAGYEILGQPVAIPPAEAAQLTALVRDPQSFTGEQSEEKMRPGVSFRFGTGADAVDLLICFSCDKITAVPAGAAEFHVTHNIPQPSREVLLAISKKLLPTDEAIQALPVVRSKQPVPPPPAPVPSAAPAE